jgi:hypothetical protein
MSEGGTERMDIVLKMMGGSLGLLVPGLFVFALAKGIDQTSFDEAQKASRRKTAMWIVAFWTLVVWAMSLAGAFSYHVGDKIPRLLIPLFVPVLAGLLVLMSKDFRAIVSHTPVSTLVGVQSFRFAGAAFLLVVYLRILPGEFVAGGIGDIVTASLAVVAAILLMHGPTAAGVAAFWGFTLAGVIDLLVVSYLILRYYPIWYEGAPSSAPLGDFALIMIPAVAAPIALLLHVYAISVVLQGATRVTANVTKVSAGGAL